MPVQSLQPPTKVVANPGNGSVLLQWTRVSGTTNYLVEYRQTGAATWTTYPHSASPARGYTITGLTNTTSYDFRVSSVSSSTTSSPSSTVSATPNGSSVVRSNDNQILSTGQSLSIGHAGGPPPLTTSQPYSNLMPASTNGGDTQVSLVEPATGADGSVESMSSAMANELTNLSSGTFPNYLSIVSMHGVNSTPYSGLAKGTGAYANGQAEQDGAFNYAAIQGNTFAVQAVTAVHGESDEANGVNAATYESYLVQWQSNYQNDAQAATGQTGIVPFFTDQNSTWHRSNHTTPNTAIGQWTAARDNPTKIFCVLPMYILDYSDGVHLNNYSYRRMGEYFGKAIKKVVVDRQPWLPLSTKAITMTGSVITAKFNVPVLPLVFDTTGVDLQSNYGFEFYDSTNSATIPGTGSVTITAPDTVQIVLSNTPTGATPALRYAFTGVIGASSGAHVAGAPKGNLRDSDTTPALYQDSNVPAAMGSLLRNWLVTFNDPITIGATTAGQPTGLGATPSITQVSLSWTAPTGNGGAPITDYLIEYKKSSNGNWSSFSHAPSASTSAVVTGLSGGTSYDFRVTPINSAGSGYTSAVLTVITYLDPASVAPVILTYAKGSNMAQLTLPSSVAGHTYQLQRTYDLVNGPWTNIGVAQYGGGALSFSDTPDPSQDKAFYRLSLR